MASDDNVFEIHEFPTQSQIACVSFVEPEIGATYMGVKRNYYPDVPRDYHGVVGEYVGGGMFDTGRIDRWCEMTGYDYLIRLRSYGDQRAVG